MSCIGLGSKIHLLLKGLVFVWVASDFNRTAVAIARVQNELKPAALPLTEKAFISLAAESALKPHALTANNDRYISRRLDTISVATEQELKKALVDGNFIVITQNITLTSTIVILSGVITVSVA